MTPGRHQATSCINYQERIYIATWNVRTLFQKGKLENAKQEMTSLNVNILGMAEVRWMRAGTFTSSDKTIINSGGQAHFRDVEIVFDKQTSKAIKGYRARADLDRRTRHTCDSQHSAAQ